MVNLAQVLIRRGHEVAIAAPEGSVVPDGLTLMQIPGVLQPTAQTQDRTDPGVAESALANLWRYAREVQGQYDLLVNFAYDRLPFALTPSFSVPVAHFVSMGSLSDRMDDVIAGLSIQFPGTLGAYSQSQADTFAAVDSGAWEVLGFGLDMGAYEYCDRPEDYLAWVGRISPEKGLEDAISAALLAKRPLKIFGKLEDGAYWYGLQPSMNRARQAVSVEYCGFLPTDELQRSLGRAQALLVTPKWTEAFGIGVVEALACGVPAIAYKRGGPAEIIADGKTGWLVEPDDVTALAEVVGRIGQINRRECRRQAIANYSLSVWGERFEQWFYKVIL